MPTRRRTSTGSTPRALMSTPSSRISPLTNAPLAVRCIAFRHRSNVDLPQPDGPIKRRHVVRLDGEVDVGDDRPLPESRVQVDDVHAARDVRADGPLGTATGSGSAPLVLLSLVGRPSGRAFPECSSVERRSSGDEPGQNGQQQHDCNQSRALLPRPEPEQTGIRPLRSRRSAARASTCGCPDSSP